MEIHTKAVCEKLDNLMIRMLVLMEEKISLTLELENQMREGCIELAKARYIRGKESVGLIQVPQDTPISSLFELETSFDEGKNQSVTPYFDIHMKCKEQNTESQDPIRWFGVLVPQSLKTSQKRFQECLYLSVKIANIETELNDASINFKNAKKLKNELSIKIEE